MTRSGIQFPDVVDLTSRAKDGTIRLIIAETATLTGNHVLGLQQKLQNYLSFALSGQLAAAHPDAKGCPVRIRVDLYAQPDDLILAFLRRFRVITLKQGIDLELSIDQQEIAL